MLTSIQMLRCRNVDPIDAVVVAAAAANVRKVVCQWPTQPAKFVSHGQLVSRDHRAIHKNHANRAILANPVTHGKFENPANPALRANLASRLDQPAHPENRERSKTKWKWKHGQNALDASPGKLDRRGKVVRAQPAKLAANRLHL